MLNIAITVPVSLSEHSPCLTRVDLLGRALQQCGHQVAWIGLGTADQAEGIQRTVHGSGVRYALRPAGVTKGRFWHSKLRHKLNQIAAAFRRGLPQALESSECQLLIDYCSYGSVSQIAWQAAQTRGIPLIGDLVEQKAPTLHRWLNGAASEQTRRDRYILPRLDGIIGISPAWVEWANEKQIPSVWVPALLDPNHVPLLPPIAPVIDGTIIDGQTSEFAARKPLPRIGWVGQWNRREHIHTVLKAIRSLSQTGQAVQLDVIGNVAKTRWAKRLIQWVHSDEILSQHVKFYGFVLESRKRQLLADADLYVLLRSESNETRKLYPTRLPEYLSFGKPVILSACSNFRPTFTHEENVWYVDPSNRQADVVVGITRLLQDPGLANRLGAAGQKRAIQALSIDSAALNLSTFLERYEAR